MNYQIGFWTLFACFCLSAFETGFKVGFEKWKAGRKKKVWHGPEEIPTRGEDEQILFSFRFNDGGKVYYGTDEAECLNQLRRKVFIQKWAYVKDLERVE